jgi:hypothetical protein
MASATRHPGESQGPYIVLSKDWNQSFPDSLKFTDEVRHLIYEVLQWNMAKTTHWRLAVHPPEFLDFFAMKC